jgi:hypothetical protein
MTIPFTQYILPHGRRRSIEFEAANENVERIAHELIERGCRFEAEILSTGMVSLTCEYPDLTLGIELSPNGPPIVAAVERLVKNAHDAYRTLTEQKNE